MGGSFQLGKLFNIPVKVHWSFALLLIYVIGTSISQGAGIYQMIFGILFTLGIFVCVVAHEYGHALTARKYGIETFDIILSPIGGVARLKSIPEKPLHEFWVTVMGPVVNLIIVFICAVILLLFFTKGDVFSIESVKEIFVSFGEGLKYVIFDETNVSGDETSTGGETTTAQYVSSYIFLLAIVNLVMFVFNLIPAFPMDGGRIFRSLLSMVLPRVKATKIASYVGQAMGLLFIAAVGAHHLIPNVTIPFADNIFLGFIGYFVFSAARKEMYHVEHKAKMDEISISDAGQSMGEINVNKSLVEAKAIVEDTDEQNYIIKDDTGSIIGILSKFDILLNAREREMKLMDLIRDDQVIQEISETIDLTEFYKYLSKGEDSIFYLFKKTEQKWYSITKDSFNQFIIGLQSPS